MTAGRASKALGALAAGLFVLGGQVPEGWAALNYDFSLGAGVTANDNFYLDPETDVEGERGPVKETTFFVSPALDLAWTAPQDHLTGQYRGEYWQFSGDEDLDPRWSHNLEADLSWRRWRPFFFEASVSLDFGPTAQERDIQPVIDYTYTNLVAARTGLHWKFSVRGEAELAYRGELETYPDVEDADPILRQYGEGLVRYRWSPFWESEFRVSYGHVERELTADYDELEAAVLVDQRLSEHLALRYGLEWIRDDYDAAPGPGAESGVHDSFLGSAEIRGDLSRGGHWRLAYEEDLDDLSDGDTLESGRASAEVLLRSRLGSTVDIEGWYDTLDYQLSGREEKEWGGTIDVRWMIAPWAAFDVRGAWTDNTIREREQAEVEDRTLGVAAGIMVLMFKRLQFETGYDYRSNDSTDELRSYTGNRFYAFATYHFRPLASGVLPSSYITRMENYPGGMSPRGW
jgi:hypothetical protein